MGRMGLRLTHMHEIDSGMNVPYSAGTRLRLTHMHEIDSPKVVPTFVSRPLQLTHMHEIDFCEVQGAGHRFILLLHLFM